jgi:hypothetical protein
MAPRAVAHVQDIHYTIVLVEYVKDSVDAWPLRKKPLPQLLVLRSHFPAFGKSFQAVDCLREPIEPCEGQF